MTKFTRKLFSIMAQWAGALSCRIKQLHFAQNCRKLSKSATITCPTPVQTSHCFSFRHKFLCSTPRLSKSDYHHSHNTQLLTANIIEPWWWFCSPRHVLYSRIALKVPSLLTSNDTIDRWTSLRGLDEVFTWCNSLLLLLTRETVW